MAYLTQHLLRRTSLSMRACLSNHIDAFEQVGAPNILGMSQWVDSGQLATNPYVSSAPICNALYWKFFERHRAHFPNNPRLGVAYDQLGKCPLRP